MTEFPELQTDRLRLREIRYADAQALLAIHGDGPSMRYFGFDPLNSLEQAHQLASRFINGRTAPVPRIRWALERKVDQVFLGTCGLFEWAQHWRKCTLGYELGRAAWGQGYMHEALRAVLPWGFEQWKLNRIEAQIHLENSASLRLAERLGFRVEGTLRQVGFWNDSYHDLQQLALLKTDFAPADSRL